MIRDNILKSFLSRYRNSSFITKEKIALLFWSHIIFLPLAVLYLIINIFRDYPSELSDIYAIDIIFITTLLAGLVLIKRGRFSIAVDIDIAAITLLTIWGHFIGITVQIETGYNGFAVLVFGVMVFTALFSIRRRQLCIVSLIFLLLTVSLYFYSSGMAAAPVYFNLLSSTLNSILTIILIFSLCYSNRTITDKAFKLAQHELKINTDLSRSLEQKVYDRTVKLAQEREALDNKNRELEEIKNTLMQRNEELEIARKTAEDANMAKNSFLAALSHEFRTPLNSIIGISGLMMERDFSDENIHTLRMIKQSGESLFFLIQDLLDFTTIENRRISIKNSFFSADELLEHIRIALKDQIENKDLVFTGTAVPDKTVVYSDRTRIAQIIMNLVTNSIKYTRSGSIELSIIIGNDMIIRVSDTGIGIDRERINSIFEAFTRIDTDYVRNQSGLGLGLSIVTQIISMMNGSIEVDSEPGKGSTFTVKLPLEKIASRDNEAVSAEAADYSIIGEKRILIVEDDVINRFYFSTLLEQAGGLVDEASNGKEALTLTDSVQYDIILMDINMPDFDGLMLARIIRNTDSINSKTLISALSAHAYSDYIKMCIDAGMNEFISKPVEREVFLNTISALLKSREI